MALKEIITRTMRLVSTEASFTASRADACFRDFQLVEIPEVMEKRLKAPEGAALMRRWFEAGSHVLTPAEADGTADYRHSPVARVDDKIIKMAWVSGFPRAATALQTLAAHRVATAPARKELRRVLARAGALTTAKRPVGGVGADAMTLNHVAHLNSVGVPPGGVIDGLECALAAFTMHMAVSGTVQPMATAARGFTHEVSVTHLHFYIRDNYDFTQDAEPLGYWSHDGASRGPSSDKAFVENRQFREWRSRFGKGGDFVVFSDVSTRQLPAPLKLEI